MVLGRGGERSKKGPELIVDGETQLSLANLPRKESQNSR